jgi:adenylate cyclase
VTFTHAGAWQISVYRETPDPDSPILLRHTQPKGRTFVAETRAPLSDKASADIKRARRTDSDVPDPTTHPTYATTIRPDLYGHAIWTDLSYSEIDAALPEAKRRVTVTVMEALEDAPGHLAGVVRVGLRIDRLTVLLEQIQNTASVPLRLLLCDDAGRLVSPVAPGDPLVEQEDTNLRYISANPPREIVESLKQAAVTQVQRDGAHQAEGSFVDGQRDHLIGVRLVEDSQDWRVVVVLAADQIPALQERAVAERRLLTLGFLVMFLVLVGGVLALGIVQRGLGRIVRSTERMRRFDFAPSPARSSLRDVQAAIESLELAKTALRAMEKYVPTDLVRQLYQTGREPMLGGELATITMMFTDIEGFTTLSERLSANELARVLGRYLEVMTRTIHGRQGMIDKYIGDAVMAVWNTPSPCPDHPQKACQAALDCVAATEALFASPEWEGTPRLVTRFGLHTDEVMVGHFGAPDRMSFTCLGDGVNLASRLEGLNKQYGTTILVSEKVYAETRRAFAFRVLDVVAVKGKKQGVRVYELLGAADIAGPRLETARRYEQAFEAYLRRDFNGALAIAAALEATDAPSRTLAARCRHFIEHPPAAAWDGTWVATSK